VKSIKELANTTTNNDVQKLANSVASALHGIETAITRYVDSVESPRRR
jgi:hypothetical protein